MKLRDVLLACGLPLLLLHALVTLLLLTGAGSEATGSVTLLLLTSAGSEATGSVRANGLVAYGPGTRITTDEAETKTETESCTLQGCSGGSGGQFLRAARKRFFCFTGDF